MDDADDEPPFAVDDIVSMVDRLEVLVRSSTNPVLRYATGEIIVALEKLEEIAEAKGVPLASRPEPELPEPELTIDAVVEFCTLLTDRTNDLDESGEVTWERSVFSNATEAVAQLAIFLREKAKQSDPRVTTSE